MEPVLNLTQEYLFISHNLMASMAVIDTYQRDRVACFWEPITGHCCWACAPTHGSHAQQLVNVCLTHFPNPNPCGHGNI